MAAFTINAKRVGARRHRRDDSVAASEIAHTVYRPDEHGRYEISCEPRRGGPSSFEFGRGTGELKMTPDP